MDSPSPTYIGLCTGYGGMEIGIQRAIGKRLNVLAYSEREVFAIENLVAKMDAGLLPEAPIWSDLRTFPAQEFSGMVDILEASYPCQPFSHAGQRKGEDDPRHLWPHISRIVATVRPLYCFFENVEGHVTLGLSTVISDLGEMGYRTTWGIFSASECGAPHQRKRVFILARLGDCDAEREHITRNGEVDGEILHPAKRQKGKHLSGASSKKLADSNERRGEQDRKPSELRADSPIESSCDCGIPDQTEGYQGWETKWPAGPGEEQHEWEPPRVLSDSPGKQAGGVCVSKQQPDLGDENSEYPEGFDERTENKPETQSRLGRSSNGSFKRVDRLRLLGNGVVPATVEKAWETLYARLDHMKELQG